MFSPEDLELRSALSTAYFNSENYDEALTQALCVVELDEKDPQAYCNLGSCYSAQNMIDEAVKSFQRASEIDPDYSLPHTNLGSLYATVGRIEKAIKEFKLATSMNPGDALGWLNLYNCFKEVGRMDDAQEAYKKYEALMNQESQAEKHSSIPGGVSPTNQLASGQNLDDGDAGLEGLKD
jgi:tetratricopeptide (TPR) repeat protein